MGRRLCLRCQTDFRDCDMLCRGDIAELWQLRDDRHAVMCVQHEHVPRETVKFLGARQTAYARKNWSSLMLFHCSRCTALTLEFVDSASGLELHRFEWLPPGESIGALPQGRWNHLIDVQPASTAAAADGGPALVHWTLGGPWFQEFRRAGEVLAAEWLSAREEAMRLWS